jgi:glycosyltransferase involved in cell wall biosynthesis
VKISIITVVYNRADTIERAVLSVNRQEHPEVEHIVIDGGSTDGTLERLSAALGGNAIFLSEPDRGMYDAINKGLNLATGDVVGLLHSDDFFPRNDVLSEVAACFQDETVDAIYGDADFFAPQALGKIVRRYSSARFTPSRLGWGWMPAHTTLFLRREVYRKFGVFKLNYRIAADFDFVCRIFRDGQLRARYIPKVLVHMQTGGLSTGGWYSTLTLNREVMRACRENHIRTNWLKLLSRYSLKVQELWRR